MPIEIMFALFCVQSGAANGITQEDLNSRRGNRHDDRPRPAATG
jgi:hypothetical protein